MRNYPGRNRLSLHHAARVGVLVAGIAACLPGMAASAAPSPPPATPNFFLRDHDRVVFYGDSITDGEWYPTLMETFVLTRYPNWRNEFFNRGQGGDNAGNLKRFQRDVVDLKPDVLTFMMGYNDGGYQRYTEAAKDTFVANVQKSVEMARAANAKTRVLLISSTPNELDVSSDNRWVSHEWYPYHLLRLARAEADLARSLGVPFVDMTQLYGQTLGFGHVLAGSTLKLSRDGVHPQQEGQTFIAYHLLKAMGADASLCAVAFDANKPGAVHTSHCKVSSLRVGQGKVSFTRTCDSLPYPTPEIARPFSFLVQLDDTINDDHLQVTGLAAPAYALWIDNKKIAELPASALAHGVNLSQFTNTPMYEQAMSVFAAVREENLLEHNFWRDYIATGKAGSNNAPLQEEARQEISAAQQKIRAAKERCYALNTPRPHAINLEPLDKPALSSDEGDEFEMAFLNAAIKPVTTNWNSRSLDAAPAIVHIENPGATAKSGSIQWRCPPGWTITPASLPFEAPAGKSADVPFAISCPNVTATDLPTATLQWNWSKVWPYPMAKQLELELHPEWTISRIRHPITIDGDLSDWTNAASFTLGRVSFIDSAVTGKRPLWDGPDDLSTKWFSAWDDESLYLAAVVRDNEHFQGEVPSMMWSQDAVQAAMYIQEQGKPDARYEFGFGAYLNPDQNRDAVVPYTASIPAESPAIQFKSHLDAAAHTCAYEIAIPWERLAPFTPAVDKSLRFTFAIGDADSQLGKGYQYLAWTPGIAYGKNPFDFGVITLGR
jgi:lysophospholipase L1-like esterase